MITRICARLACVGATIVPPASSAAGLDLRATHALELLTWREASCALPEACIAPPRPPSPGRASPPPPPKVFALDPAKWLPAAPLCSGVGRRAAASAPPPFEFQMAIHVRSLAHDFEHDRNAAPTTTWNESARYDRALWRAVAAAVVSKAAAGAAADAAAPPRVYVAADHLPIRAELVARLRERGAVACVAGGERLGVFTAGGALVQSRHGALVHSRHGDATSDDVALGDWVSLGRAASVVVLEMRCRDVSRAECHDISVLGDGVRLSSFVDTATAATLEAVREQEDRHVVAAAPAVFALKRLNATDQQGQVVRLLQLHPRRRWGGEREHPQEGSGSRK